MYDLFLKSRARLPKNSSWIHNWYKGTRSKMFSRNRSRDVKFRSPNSFVILNTPFLSLCDDNKFVINYEI